MKREGFRIARCTVERLMADLEIHWVTRGRTWKGTTTTDKSLHRPRDLVERQFSAKRPNRLWEADLSYVKTHNGFV